MSLLTLSFANLFYRCFEFSLWPQKKKKSECLWHLGHVEWYKILMWESDNNIVNNLALAAVILSKHNINVYNQLLIATFLWNYSIIIINFSPYISS